jgi:hypothetical protein
MLVIVILLRKGKDESCIYLSTFTAPEDCQSRCTLWKQIAEAELIVHSAWIMKAFNGRDLSNSKFGTGWMRAVNSRPDRFVRREDRDVLIRWEADSGLKNRVGD